jgi:hypothetical protein
MHTEFNVEQLQLQEVGCRTVEGRFDAGRTSCDGGLLLQREGVALTLTAADTHPTQGAGGPRPEAGEDCLSQHARPRL